MERFARTHRERLAIIGLGTQDSLAEAREFAAAGGTRSVPMVWDATGRSWDELGVPTQPAAVLFDRRGRERGRWFGPFDEDEVLGRAGIQ